MLGIEEWVKILFLYGPVAILVFFVFVVEKKARNAMRTRDSREKIPLICVYVANWVIIFSLVSLAVYAWLEMNVKKTYIMKGSFENLKAREIVTSKTPHIYFHRLYDVRDNFDYEWCIITGKPLCEDERIKFTFDRSTINSEMITVHELPIQTCFYDQKVRIVYRRENDKVLLLFNEKEQELPNVFETLVEREIIPGGGAYLFRNAYAGEVFSAKSYSSRLEANDPIIRQDARIDLANEGDAAIEWIKEVLTDPDSSYRLRLGAIYALAKMDDFDTSKLGASIVEIVSSSADPDPTMRRYARLFLKRNPSRELKSILDSEVEREKKGSHSSERLIYLSLAELDLCYNLGVMEKDLYGSRKLEDRPRIDKAIAAFADAWELRSLVPVEFQIYFAKSLYGWGHALHDRSWIELRSNGSRDLRLVRLAQEKFEEFLDEYSTAPNPEAYPYPIHVKRARAYIGDPIPESLWRE